MLATLLPTSTTTARRRWRTRLHRLGAAVLVAALAAPAFADQPRILCIGDSITQGGRRDRDESTYRLPLQAMLNRAGIDYDFIGTRRAGLQAEAVWPAWFDPDHEGFYGARTAEVRDRLRAHLQVLPAPDVALVALGTNDRDGDFVQPLEDIGPPRSAAAWPAMRARWRGTA